MIMNYIIEIDSGLWFCGWSTLDGSLKTTDDVALAYRMRRPLAERTLPKVLNQFGRGSIIRRTA
jgi:hypothetical protein